MGTPVVGDLVLIPFPYSDLSKSKRRPELVVADVGRVDYGHLEKSQKMLDATRI